MQPRGPGFGRDYWRGTVIKMVTVYKAPIAPEDVDKLADYLAAAYAE